MMTLWLREARLGTEEREVGTEAREGAFRAGWWGQL